MRFFRIKTATLRCSISLGWRPYGIFGEKFLIIGQGSGMILCMAELRAELFIGG